MSWDVFVSILCLAALTTFAVMLAVFTALKKPKTIPATGVVCSLVLMLGVTLAAHAPGIVGSGANPGANLQTDSATQSSAGTVAKRSAEGSTSSLPRMAYAESRFTYAGNQAKGKMTRAESQFKNETQTSAASSGSASSSASEQQPGTNELRVLKAPGTVQRGGTASLYLQGKSNEHYTVKVVYASGSTGAGSTYTSQADIMGRCAFSWTVGNDIVPGVHFITVSGGGQALTTSFTTE